MIKTDKINNKEMRCSNLELFRIISMLLIIAHHFVVNSGLTADGGMIFSQITNWKSIFLLIFGAWGKVGINCFVLITGYFMCKKNISIRKYIKLLGEIYFYRIVLYIIFLLAGYETIGVSKIIYLLLPVSEVSHDFTGCFLIFYLCIPFLNILINNMKEQEHIYLLIIMGVVYIVLPTLHMEVTFNYVTWFSIIYLIASYIRFYPKKIYSNTKFWLLTSLLMIFASIVSIVICSIGFLRFGINPVPFYFISDSNKFLAVVVSLSLFLFFLNIKIKNNKIINTISSTTFGVLCIHAGSNAMRAWLWQDVIDCVGHYNIKYMPIYAIGSIIAIFVICSLIDFIRIKFIERYFFDLWDNKLSKKLDKCWIINKLKFKKID